MTTGAKSPYAVFCEMLRHESAKPVVARARNFVDRFPAGLSRYDAAEKTHDFMTQTEKLMFEEILVFQADADEQGRMDAAEGLEKMILCRLFPKLFEIDSSDVEEDAKLKKHISGLAWVKTEHLGIPDIEISLWPRVIEELRRMDDYKAPCDKLTCIVNACHVINDVLKLTQAELGTSRPLSADDFLPLLILAVIKANPVRFHHNVEFVAAFRHPSRLNGEHAYWITMLMSAKEFVRHADHKTLDVSVEEYDRLYAAALAAADRNDAPSISIHKVNSGSSISTAAETKSPTTKAESEPVLEHTLLEQKEVLVYQIPAVSSATGHRAAEWQSVIWRGPCSVAAKGKDLAIRMMDKTSGRLFAECLIPANECDNYVEPVTDSGKHFALKIMNGEKRALIGLCFAEELDASKFQSILQQSGWAVKGKDKEATPSSQSQQLPHDSPLQVLEQPVSPEIKENSGYSAAEDVAVIDLGKLSLQSNESMPSTQSQASSSTQQMPKQESQRPAVGDLVEITNEDAPRVTGTIGMSGTITENDYSDMPFKVSLPYGDMCWYKEEWVRVVTKEDAAMGIQQCSCREEEDPFTFLGSTVASRSPCSSQSFDPFDGLDILGGLPDVHNSRMPVAA